MSSQSDASVIQTNDEATSCKKILAEKGYINDPFIPYFPSPAFDMNSPEINRGYYVRYEFLHKILDDSSISFGPAVQIVSLGAGHDTFFYVLMQTLQGFENLRSRIRRYVEVDFGSVVRKKVGILRRYRRVFFAGSECVVDDDDGDEIFLRETPFFVSDEDGDDVMVDADADADADDEVVVSRSACLFQTRLRRRLATTPTPTTTAQPEEDVSEVSYSLIGCDMRKTSLLTRLLDRLDVLDPQLPCLILSEMVLIYLDPKFSDPLIRYFSTKYSIPGSLFVIYEAFNPHDDFGKQMVDKLRKRGCPLLSIQSFDTLEKMRLRMTNQQYRIARARTLLEIYGRYFAPTIRAVAMRAREMLDEFTLFNMLMSHYCVVIGANPPRGADDAFEANPFLAEWFAEEDPRRARRRSPQKMFVD